MKLTSVNIAWIFHVVYVKVGKSNMNTKQKRIRKLIKSTGYKIGYARFIKQNGDLREMWFQSKIAPSLLKGGPRKYNPDEKHLCWVRDIMEPDHDCIRSIKWDNVICLAIRHKRYVFRRKKKNEKVKR